MGTGAINLNFKEGLEKYKGKILGFDKNGYAVYTGEGMYCQAMQSCECCGQTISSCLTSANFCPICAITLGLVSFELAQEVCLDSYKGAFQKFDEDNDFRRAMYMTADGFKKGIQFALNNAIPSLKGRISFDYHI